VAAILNMPAPKTKSELLTWLGMTGYYRKSIPSYSEKADELRRLLTKDVVWGPDTWGPNQQAAFEELRQLLVQAPVLRTVRPGRPFVLAVDWSVKGMGAVLSQVDEDGLEYVVAYASRSNNAAERNYTSYKGEMLAGVWAAEHFRLYLLGRPFRLMTDHQPLSFLMKSNKLTGIYARWALRLQEYDFTIIYRPGAANANADCPSRFPLPDIGADWECFREEMDYHTAAPPACLAARVACIMSVTVEADAASGEPLGDAAAVRPRPVDIWDDAATVAFLLDASSIATATPAEQHRVRQRAAQYSLQHSELLTEGFGLRKRSNGRVVPRPAERLDIVRQAHQDWGHFGVKRTLSLLTPTFWWHSMGEDVVHVVRSCEPCNRQKAVFNVRPQELGVQRAAAGAAPA
jgi:hypothetical protein